MPLSDLLAKLLAYFLIVAAAVLALKMAVTVFTTADLVAMVRWLVALRIVTYAASAAFAYAHRQEI